MRALRWLTEAAIALSIYIAIGSSTAQAHPHVWIDLRSTVVLDMPVALLLSSNSGCSIHCILSSPRMN